MPIIDVQFKQLEANRKVPKKETSEKGVQVKNNSKVKDIEKKEVPGAGEAVVVDFEYSVKYEPNFGDITVGGSVVYHDKNLDDKIEEEDGDIKLKGDAYMEVQNAILGSGSTQAIVLSKELKLPPPIQLPRVKAEEEKGNKSKKGYA